VPNAYRFSLYTSAGWYDRTRDLLHALMHQGELDHADGHRLLDEVAEHERTAADLLRERIEEAVKVIPRPASAHDLEKLEERLTNRLAAIEARLTQ